MPYANEYAGLEAIRLIADSGMVDEFRDAMVSRKPEEPLLLPDFLPCPPNGRVRGHVLAIDGSVVTKDIPGALPCTEAGLVSLGVVVMNLNDLSRLERLPQSGAVNPRLLRETEHADSLGVILPGRNAARNAGFSCTVSERALIILAPSLRSFAHPGTRPQRSFASVRSSPSWRTEAKSWVGHPLKRGRRLSAGDAAERR